MNIVKRIFKLIDYIFFAKMSDYFILLANGYLQPSIYQASSCKQEIKESLRMIVAAFLISSCVLYLLKNFLFFDININITMLINIPKLFILSLFSNIIFGVFFAMLIAVLLFVYYQTKNQLIYEIVIKCFFYIMKLYALLMLPCIVIAYLLYVNILCYGVIKLNPHSGFTWSLLILFAFISIFSIWWFYFNPIYKMVDHYQLKPRKITSTLDNLFSKIKHKMLVFISRIKIISIIIVILMYFFVPNLITLLLPDWNLLNVNELRNEVINAPYYQKHINQ